MINVPDIVVNTRHSILCTVTVNIDSVLSIPYCYNALISDIICVVKSHTPNDPHSSAPLIFNTCHILTCHIPLCLVSRAYVSDTTSYIRCFAWTLLGEHAAVILC